MSHSSESKENLFVVGIGASAGGLSALEELFSNLSISSGAAFVVIQHLSPDFKSLMKELLGRHTTMPIYRVTEGMKLQPNSVFLIPPGQNLVLEENILHLEDRKKDKNQKHELNFPIDLFFTSLAKNYGERSIGVILSGSGSDGTRGLKAVNEAGGIALVQDPKTAEFDGMPKSAIATEVVNRILPPRELAQLIYQCVTAPANSLQTEADASYFIDSVNLNLISKMLFDEAGLDFSQYKSSTISRRIHRRCLIHNTASIDRYIKLLNDSSEERQILCSDLLINVTHFFRDYSAWQNLENNILPRLVEQADPEGELRFWVTACSTGEEAYSLAILVHEAIQDLNKNVRVKIFATDIDRVALEKASQGIYPSSIATDLGHERLQRYFVLKDNSYQIMRKIREMLIFSPHDLTKDAGFTRINLITCRNVLIYMKPELQDRVLRNLHFSLVSKGILFLGEAETLGNFESEFKTLNKKWKFFQKQRDIRLSLPLRSTPKIERSSNFRLSPTQSKESFEPILEQCLERLAEESDSIILTIDQNYNLLHVSGDSGTIFKALGGKITTQVTTMIVQPLQLPLNAALHRVKQQRKKILYQGIKLEHQGKILDTSLEVIPPKSDRQDNNFFVVKIQQQVAAEQPKIPEVENFELGSEASRRILELENELQQTRENLQALVEELETTNEEQQASNEELTASNEELQSTNEELHSVNEELHTVNLEYQSKISELTQLNDDVDNLLQSTDIGVIFLDGELKIRKFTPAVTTAIALRSSDLERPLAELYWKFECPNLFDLLHEVLVTKQPQELEVKLKQSDNYLLMQIHLYQTENGDSDGLVISFIKIDEIKQTQLSLEREIIARKRSEEQLKINQEKLRRANLDLERRVAERTQTLAQFSDRLQQLHRLSTADSQDLDDIFRDYLQAGCQMLGLTTGIVSEVTDCIYKIAALESPLNLEVGSQNPCTNTHCTDCIYKIAALESPLNLEVGSETPYTNTYCDEIVETKGTIAFAAASKIESMQNHPVYLNLKLESFIATPILVDGNVYGTLNFADTTPRELDFTQEEIKIVELMARDLGNFISSIRSEAALKESELRFRSTFEQAAVGVAHVSPEGQFIKVNQRLCDILGYTSETLLDTTFQTITHPDDLNADLNYVRQMLAGEISTYSMEKRYIKSDRSIVWINLTVSLVKDNSGQPDYFISVIEDIEARKNTEIALEQADLAKDKFIAHMSHELRTPLTSILGFSKLLQQEFQQPAQKLGYAKIIHQSGQHLLELINDILDFSKITAHQLQLTDKEFDLILFLNQIVANSSLRAIDRGLEFVTVFAPDLPTNVRGDFKRLRQVLDNLLSNALKFTQAGTITFKVRYVETDEAKQQEVAQNHEISEKSIAKLRFEVEDTGVGISPDQFSNIFIPFQQLENQIADIKGTGLGLSISQNILQLMNSEIKLVSELNRGSKFWFDLELPVVAPYSDLTTLYDFNWQQSRRLRVPKKVLVIDDHQENRILMVNFLQSLGFIMAEANNGKVGLEVATVFQPDIILTDLVMPVMDGKEIIARIKQNSQLQHIPIFTISANSEFILKPNEFDGDEFLAKPIDLERLLELFNNYLQLDWQLENTVEEDDNLSTFDVPDRDYLLKLLESVQLGDIEGIDMQLDCLLDMGDRYTTFADKTRKLTANLQLEKLELFVDRLLEN